MEEQGEIRQWTHRDLLDIGGDKIGTIEDVRYDDIGETPKWLIVRSGLFGTRRMVVPAAETRASSIGLAVPYTKERIKNAPHVTDTEFLSGDDELALGTYYGLENAASEAMYTGGRTRH